MTQDRGLTVIKNNLSQALPGIVKSLGGRKDVADRLMQAALIAYTTDGHLKRAADANPVSFLMAVKTAADSGLDIGGVRRHGALVPYGNVVQFIPQYQGYIHLMTHGEDAACDSVEAQVVHELDEFEYSRSAKDGVTLVHKPFMDGDPGKVWCAYAIARLKNGTVVAEVMRLDELEAIRKRARSQKGPWSTDTEAMYRKCPIRRISKFLPLTNKVVQFAHLEDEEDKIIDVEVLQPAVEEAVSPAPPPEEKPKRTPRKRRVQRPKEGAPKAPPQPEQPPQAPPQQPPVSQPVAQERPIQPPQDPELSALMQSVSAGINQLDADEIKLLEQEGFGMRVNFSERPVNLPPDSVFLSDLDFEIQGLLGSR